MRRGLFLVTGIASWCAVVAVASANDVQDFLHARQAYDAGQFEVAVERFERLVGGAVPRLSETVYIVESRKYLGAAYVLLGRNALAESQFEQLLAEAPEVRIDEVVFPAEVVELFESVRQRIVQARRQEAEEARLREQEARRREAERLLRERERLQRLRDLAASETVERHNSRLLATVPFGVGQFQNGDETLGWTLAISEGVLAIGSIATFFIHQTIPANLQFEGTEKVVRISNQVVTGIFAAVAIGGVIQAHVAFVPTVTETRERDMPEDLEPSDSPPATLGLGLGPAGGSLTLTF